MVLKNSIVKIMKMQEVKAIELYGLKFTADDLGDIADIMDNSKLLPKEFEDVGEFIERIGSK